MILINSDETVPTPEYGESGFEEFMGTWMAYNQKLIDGGHWVSPVALYDDGRVIVGDDIRA